MSDKRNDFTYVLTYNESHPNGIWIIYSVAERWSDSLPEEHQMFGRPVAFLADDPDWHGDGPPPHVRAEYERLIGYEPQQRLGRMINVVEMIAEGDCAFDQPCAYGHRVDGHAVYCHNDEWLYAPRKCRRTWSTGGERRDEDCEGFAPNPLRAEVPS